MKRISVNLTEKQFALLHQIARKTGLKFAEVLRRVIDEALKAQQRQERC